MRLKKKSKKVVVIGLDCASPELVFEKFRDELPNLKRMMEGGSYANLRSIHPPITVPAWMSICSGKDAGELGVYGFRERVANSYTDYRIINSQGFSGVSKIWDILARYRKKSILIGVPPSYPPYPVNGYMVSCFICPERENDFTYPQNLKKKILKLSSNYLFDVKFRIEDRGQIKENAWQMVEERFKVIEYLFKRKSWDFFMFVEIGLDRIQHAFWKYFDKSHHLYQPGHKYKDVILDFYRLLDEKIGRLLSLLDDNTVIFVVSDHGVKAMKGCFCINEWFIEKGYLVLKKYPEKVTSLEDLKVDWEKSKAWGWGGYYGRIFINRKGREVFGNVEEDEYEEIREKIIAELTELRDREGNLMDTRVYRPEDLYQKVNGNPADLMVYFDNLSYRSAATVGHKKIFLDENDTGPDDAVHDWDGIFIKYAPKRNGEGELSSISLLDFPKLLLEEMGLRSKNVTDEYRCLKAQLKTLGYI